MSNPYHHAIPYPNAAPMQYPFPMLYHPMPMPMPLPQYFHPQQPQSFPMVDTNLQLTWGGWLPPKAIKFQMHFHNWMNKHGLKHIEDPVSYGPRNEERWKTTITINGIKYHGYGRTKQNSRDHASCFALIGLGVDLYSLKD